jgi:hypothetical protein
MGDFGRFWAILGDFRAIWAVLGAFCLGVGKDI